MFTTWSEFFLLSLIILTFASMEAFLDHLPVQHFEKLLYYWTHSTLTFNRGRKTYPDMSTHNNILITTTWIPSSLPVYEEVEWCLKVWNIDGLSTRRRVGQCAQACPSCSIWLVPHCWCLHVFKRIKVQNFSPLVFFLLELINSLKLLSKNNLISPTDSPELVSNSF